MDLLGLGLALLIAGFGIGWRAFTLRRHRSEVAQHAEAEAVRVTGEAEAAQERSRAEAEVHQRRIELEERFADEARSRQAVVTAREDELARRAASLAEQKGRVVAREEALEERSKRLRKFEDQKRSWDALREESAREARATLERVAGESAISVRDRLTSEWVEEARSAAADLVRRVDGGGADLDEGREAKRLMGVAVQRYQGHYLTERLLSNLQLVPGTEARVLGEGDANLAIIESISNVKLTLSEDRTAIRLEGQDSFGREIARRAINRLGKGTFRGNDLAKGVEQIKADLDREVSDLGRRAFKELKIERAHPEIVRLVGLLNWRTSYTQNQWKHALEAAFLCGMLAAEMGLDVRLARRAALMHDIGKALTHAIDGSHAVIGADYARRLGESELVANAIGAHHGDEPANSVYASLVAACDAMSGARPGARREQTDNYVQRREDLERIGAGFPGVERAFAVQGGREIRVYVSEGRISDEGAVDLSSQIARKISDELTFPGQIKVTVIREMRAVEVAG